MQSSAQSPSNAPDRCPARRGHFHRRGNGIIDRPARRMASALFFLLQVHVESVQVETDILHSTSSMKSNPWETMLIMSVSNRFNGSSASLMPLVCAYSAISRIPATARSHSALRACGIFKMFFSDRRVHRTANDWLSQVPLAASISQRI